MLSINQLKFIRSLHQAKYRKQHRLFLAEGPKIVAELMDSPYRDKIKSVLGTENWFKAQSKTLQPEIEFVTIGQKELERISTLKSPREVVAVVEMMEPTTAELYSENELVLALDGIRDPGNLGTILRTADWFGYRNILCSHDCVELYNPKVVQASMGSIARVQVAYQDLSLVLQKQKEVPVYGAVLDGKNVYRIDLQPKGYLIIGNESRGISRNLLSFITYPLSIPSAGNTGTDRAESLNASIATAILCSEFHRRLHSI